MIKITRDVVLMLGMIVAFIPMVLLVNSLVVIRAILFPLVFATAWVMGKKFLLYDESGEYLGYRRWFGYTEANRE